jgi:hypothetical protein
MDKIVCTWSGNMPGLPGYSTFYTSPSQGPACQPKLITFWQSMASYLPAGFNITIPNSGVTLNDLDGEPITNWSGGTVSTIPSTGLSSFSSVSGAQIKWLTGQYRRGKRVTGRTFIVPIYMSAYATGGVLAANVVAGIKTAAQTLTSTPGQFVVWHRPKVDDSIPPITLFSGEQIPVTGVDVPTKVTYLRTRRD